MIEHQQIRVTTPQCWYEKEVKRPLFSYRGKVWCWVALFLAAFWSISLAVVQELTR